jgi:hypothetical protein
MVHERTHARWISVASMVGILLSGCDPTVGDADEFESKQAALASANGLRAINGLRARNGLSENGLTAINGSTSLNGLRSRNGLASNTGLMTTPEGRDTVAYLVRCALPSGQSITKQDQNGVSYTFQGKIGVAPQWGDAACDQQCQQHVTACMLAHVNTTGRHIPLWIVGDSQAIGWGQSPDFPYQEGSFFGNIFTSPPTAFYCNGQDFDQGVVPGRLGANQIDAPYVNPWASVGGACKSYCTPQDIPNQNDGFKACYGYNHVVTVWRNFDAQAAYKICSKASGKCLDAASTTDGAAVVQRTYTGATSQKWSVVQVATGKYKVVNGRTGKAMSLVAQRTSSSSAAVVLTTYSGTNQQWSFSSMRDGTGQYRLTPGSNTANALALPSTGVKIEGQAVQQLAWKSTDSAMKWTIVIAE